MRRRPSWEAYVESFVIEVLVAVAAVATSLLGRLVRSALGLRPA